MNFKEFIKINEQNIGLVPGKHNDFATGAFVDSGQTGSETPDQGIGRQPQLFGVDLLPTITKRAPLVIFEKNKNPIFMQLADNTRISLTWDEFRRTFSEEPIVGQEVTVTFQRFPGDKSEEYSQIASIKLGPKPPKK